MTKKKEKTLFDLYQEEGEKPTPREAFILKIAEVTCRHPQTIKQWFAGMQSPDALTMRVISEKFGVTKIR
jgi:hypothetical protein